MKINDWLKENKKFFFEGDLQYLLKTFFLKDYIFLYLENYELKRQEINYLEKIKKLYLKGMPLAYLIKRENFFGLDFNVNHSVFIPRKETELIVEEAIRIIKTEKLRYVLDLGCGCANIGLCIKRKIPSTEVVFSDISFSALKVASLNLFSLNIKGLLINCELLSAFKKNIFDIIISNPPYVEEEAFGGSLKYEPSIALKAKEGIFFIKRIIENAHFHLRERGKLILEFGYNQKKSTEKILERLSFWKVKKWIKDYSGFWRGVVLEKNG